MVCDKCQEVIAMGYLHKEAIIISTFLLLFGGQLCWGGETWLCSGITLTLFSRLFTGGNQRLYCLAKANTLTFILYFNITLIIYSV